MLTPPRRRRKPLRQIPVPWPDDHPDWLALDRQLPDSARIWVSPARRTEQTAHALQRKFRFSPALSPMGSSAQLLEFARGAGTYDGGRAEHRLRSRQVGHDNLARFGIEHLLFAGPVEQKQLRSHVDRPGLEGEHAVL